VWNRRATARRQAGRKRPRDRLVRGRRCHAVSWAEDSGEAPHAAEEGRRSPKCFPQTACYGGASDETARAPAGKKRVWPGRIAASASMMASLSSVTPSPTHSALALQHLGCYRPAYCGQNFLRRTGRRQAYLLTTGSGRPADPTPQPLQIPQLLRCHRRQGWLCSRLCSWWCSRFQSRSRAPGQVHPIYPV
jgi:hypothetical protein